MFGVNVVKRQKARRVFAAKQIRTLNTSPRTTRSAGNDAARAKQMNDLREWAFEGKEP